jgi:hypothetical protein
LCGPEITFMIPSLVHMDRFHVAVLDRHAGAAILSSNLQAAPGIPLAAVFAGRPAESKYSHEKGNLWLLDADGKECKGPILGRPWDKSIRC